MVGEMKSVKQRIDEAYRHLEPEYLLRKAIKKYGLRWIIAHYQTAIVNWNLCLDEVLELRKENKKLRERKARR